jgi:transposase
MPLLPGRDQPQHAGPRYPSDMSDAEWQVIEPALPAPAWKAGKGGRPAQRCRRDYVDAVRYLVKEGIQWQAMPADFPHWRTACDLADGWHKSGATGKMHDDLRRQCRIAAGRKPEPTAAIIDSQSVKAAEEVSRASRGYDAGKKVNGRKRHIAVDTIGLLLTVLITAACLQDRDAAKPLLRNLRRAFPSVKLVWADGGYAGKLVTWAKTKLKPKLTLQTVKRPDDLHTFQVLPRRWVVERTLCLDHPVPPHRPRLRTPARPPRNHRVLGDDHHHDPAPRPPGSASANRYLVSKQALRPLPGRVIRLGRVGCGCGAPWSCPCSTRWWCRRG